MRAGAAASKARKPVPDLSQITDPAVSIPVRVLTPLCRVAPLFLSTPIRIRPPKLVGVKDLSCDAAAVASFTYRSAMSSILRRGIRARKSSS
eukprot:scaffold109392_cov72-Phaeocystis_antarctica.AAC.3